VNRNGGNFGGGREMAVARDSNGREIMCRSCGIRPGRPTAIIGQLTATELCDVCAALRKERIRQNRAMARGYRI
jgi:hypothetical protein